MYNCPRRRKIYKGDHLCSAGGIKKSYLFVSTMLGTSFSSPVSFILAWIYTWIQWKTGSVRSQQEVCLGGHALPYLWRGPMITIKTCISDSWLGDFPLWNSTWAEQFTFSKCWYGLKMTLVWELVMSASWSYNVMFDWCQKTWFSWNVVNPAEISDLHKNNYEKQV